MSKVYLSLGSNIGDKLGYLKKAISFLQDDENINNLLCSSFYETDPQGFIKQSTFVNCVVEFETDLDPYALLKICQSIEVKLKRVRLFRWGPRTIDVDILTYEDIIINREDLIIPHERMLERAFVLVPLCELDPGYNKYLENVKDQKVRKIIV